MQNDALIEDQLNAELIEQGKKMNELRQEHEQALYELRRELSQKSETELARVDSDYRQNLQVLRDEIGQFNAKVKTMERNEKKAIIEKEKVTNLKEQIYILQERLKNIETDRDLVE